MIYETLEIIKDQVSKYLELKLTDSNLVVLENIAKLDDPDVTTMNDKIALTLINIDEEIALKNYSKQSYKNGETLYRNKPIHLNLYILFSANRGIYEKSLTAISTIVEFFQSKKIFTQTNTKLNPIISALSSIKEFKFTVELYTPTFEQLNYVWGTLGGKAVPSAMYRVSLVRIERDAITEKGTQISEVSTNANPI